LQSFDIDAGNVILVSRISCPYCYWAELNRLWRVFTKHFVDIAQTVALILWGWSKKVSC